MKNRDFLITGLNEPAQPVEIDDTERQKRTARVFAVGRIADMIQRKGLFPQLPLVAMLVGIAAELSEEDVAEFCAAAEIKAYPRMQAIYNRVVEVLAGQVNLAAFRSTIVQ